MPIVSIIAAIDENNAIGKEGKLLCRLPSDLARFKKITTAHSIIMGRKTFESLPNGALPDRRNIVISRKNKAESSSYETVDSLQKAIDICAGEEEIFVIGGGEIYHQAIDLANKLYITHIHHKFDNADTFFPEIKADKWNNISNENNPLDEEDEHTYIFSEYVRVSEKSM